MHKATTPYRVHQCFKCPGDTEYYCESCSRDLCPQCKEFHVKSLKTIDHNVMTRRDKINYIPKQEICARHPNNIYKKYCEPCQIPVCDSCSGHNSHRFNVSLFRQRKHYVLCIGNAYKIKQQQHRGTIHTIRSEALFHRPVLLTEITDDIKICQTNFSLYQSEMLTKAKKLKDQISSVQNDFMCNVFCYFDFKHRCLKQKIEMNRQIARLQTYVNKYEQSSISALKFLSFIKTTLSQIHPTLHTSQLSMTESLHKENVMELLSAIQITERGNRRVKIECLLKLKSAPEFHQSFTVSGVVGCDHISCMPTDQVWISDGINLILTDTTGLRLHRVEDFCKGLYSSASHTVDSENELIYIDRKHSINKLSKIKTTTTFLERTDYAWIPRCVYWSASTGDLLVGMHYNRTNKGKVTRYNQRGQLTQTIEHDNKGLELYRKPRYITENNNGNVVVSSYRAVVVTERGGRHRFSYTGHPSGSKLWPRGICTDALSHILLCDDRTHTVQLIHRDGQFLSHLLIRQSGIFTPYSLSYDVNTHLLWVGSYNKVVVYKYLDRHDPVTDTAYVMESSSRIHVTERGNRCEGNECLLKLMSGPELHQSIRVRGVRRCYHISGVTSDRVWVSDRKNNLILANLAGVTLHRVNDLCIDLFGAHTVNSETELIYIDTNYNINKMSKDLKTTTAFSKRTDSTWRPQSVYWSPCTGDLLVGMCYIYTETGKVTRYNQSGKLTQTIQHDNTGRKLYRCPYYITENNNGDVVVSDSSAVVVTERGKRHRFSYTGHPSGSELWPRGICTDALSHILVCDSTTKTVQMLDNNGQFLSHLLTKSQEIGEPWSLSYDVKTHLLWVGSCNNKLSVYRYIKQQNA